MIKKLFSKLNPQQIVDTVFSGVDKAILSKEELVDYAKQAAEMNLEFVKLTQQESTPRSISRRVIAILVIGEFILAFNVGLVGIISGWYDGKEILTLSSDAFGWAVGAVIIFYFGNHLANTVVSRFANKKK